MRISFVNVEPEGQSFFSTALAGQELEFVKQVDWVAPDAEVVSVFIDSRIDKAFVDTHPALKCVATRSQSQEHIDLAACHSRGVEVFSVPTFGQITVAEHTFALILALSRRLREVMTMPSSAPFSYEATRGFDLFGKTLGIVGMGAVGQRVAAIAQAFSMEVLACDLEEKCDLAGDLNFQYVELEELLRNSHVVSLHTNLTAETYHLINKDSLAKCRHGVLLINTARGALVHTEALREALDSGQVGGAGLDVLEDERVMRESVSQIIGAEIVKHLLSNDRASEERDARRLSEMQDLMLSDGVLSRPNVVFTPHVAFNSVETVRWVREKTLHNIQRFLASAGAAAS